MCRRRVLSGTVTCRWTRKSNKHTHTHKQSAGQKRAARQYCNYPFFSVTLMFTPRGRRYHGACILWIWLRTCSHASDPVVCPELVQKQFISGWWKLTSTRLAKQGGGDCRSGLSLSAVQFKKSQTHGFLFLLLKEKSCSWKNKISLSCTESIAWLWHSPIAAPSWIQSGHVITWPGWFCCVVQCVAWCRNTQPQGLTTY